MKISLKRFKGLPCEAEEFKINEQDAALNDFGSGQDERANLDTTNLDPDIVHYGCCNHVWRRDPNKKLSAMRKYNLTEEEWNTICKKLEATFSAGFCGWCV